MNRIRKKLIVDLPEEWEEIDYEHLYESVSDATFLADNVTTPEHKLVCSLLTAFAKFQYNEKLNNDT